MMKTAGLSHSWDLTPKEAIQLQRQLRDQVRTDLCLDIPERIAGVDVAYIPQQNQSVATVALLAYPELKVIEASVARVKTSFPYIPGLLSFRETPAILAATEKLSGLPELIFVDGHGYAHPRRFGIACHLGLCMQVPTIGIGKSVLCGEFKEPGKKRGMFSDLIDKGEVIGRLLRTRDGVQPIFVSVGYGLPLDECVRWTLSAAPRFRIPEPIRQAHQIAARNV